MDSAHDSNLRVRAGSMHQVARASDGEPNCAAVDGTGSADPAAECLTPAPALRGPFRAGGGCPGPASLDGAERAESQALPFVSVVLVVRNEDKQISRCLSQILLQTYPKTRLEILVVDGMSTDRTRELVESFPTTGIPLWVIPNPGRGRAQGLNLGILHARGDVITRVDARTVLGPDYLLQCVQTLLDTGADNVGGIQRPIAETPTQEAIGLALSHPFGVGNAEFRLGRKSGYVDTVYLGCFRREIFDRVGLFDEDAPVISEDSDMNQRIRAAGGNVYLNKEIVACYYPRATWPELFKLYFRYGGARAGNLRKHRSLTSLRQTIAPAFVLSLALLPLLALAFRPFLWLLAAEVVSYSMVDTVVSLRCAVRAKRLGLFPRMLLTFPCLHVAWGLGFWKRLIIAEPGGRQWAN